MGQTETEANRKGASNGTLRLLYVGNCVATRSIPLVLTALKKEETHGVSLTVVGNGPVLQDWKDQANSMGLSDRVRFTGSVGRDDLPALYGAADALVFPALRDAGGSALLEAMSIGLPVICLDWGGPAEMVADNTGFKVSVGSPRQTVDELASVFTRLRDNMDLRHTVGETARDHVQRAFSWEAKRDLLTRTYRRLLERPS